MLNNGVGICRMVDIFYKVIHSFKKVFHRNFDFLLTLYFISDILCLSFRTTDFELGVLISVFANYSSRNANPLHPLSAEIYSKGSG